MEVCGQLHGPAALPPTKEPLVPIGEGQRDQERAWTLRRKMKYALDQCYSTFFVRVPPDIISLQLCTPEVVGV
jgi:hypothetical protein